MSLYANFRNFTGTDWLTPNEGNIEHRLFHFTLIDRLPLYKHPDDCPARANMGCKKNSIESKSMRRVVNLVIIIYNRFLNPEVTIQEV